MRIALIIYGSLDTLSGGYLYDRMLVQHLRGRGHDVELVTLPWRSYPAHLADNLSRRWRERLAALDVDLLVQDELNHPSLAWVNGWLRPALTCPLVSIVHHLRSSENHPALLGPLHHWVERRYLRSVDGCIFNSATTQATVEQLAGRTFPHIVAYPAADHLDAPDLLFLHEKLRAQRQSAAPLRLLFVGNVIERKGLHTILAALARLPAASATLDVVGSLDVAPRYVMHIRRQIARLQLGSRVRLHGALPQPALVERLTDSDLFVAPSYEGFGIVYLEAMAFGLPVIAATSGAAHEIVHPSENGFLIAPNDAATLAGYIAQLAQDRERLAALAVAARQRYDQHPTWQQTCEGIERWLGEFLKMWRPALSAT